MHFLAEEAIAIVSTTFTYPINIGDSTSASPNEYFRLILVRKHPGPLSIFIAKIVAILHSQSWKVLLKI